MPITRRHLQVALALLWVLDGALQLQPAMLTRAFADRVVRPAAQGQPAVVADPVRWAAHAIAWHPAVADVAFAAVQLAIGLALLVRPLVRPALAASVLWGLGVWWFGEGAGGVLGGHTSLLAGAPGAALLYVVLAVAAWPSEPGGCDARRYGALRPRGRRGATALPPRGWVVHAWAAVWMLGAVLRALPSQASARALHASLLGAATGAPSWVAGIDHTLARAAMAAGGGVVAVLVVLQVLVAVLALGRGRARVAAAAAGVALALVAWVAGQGLGDLTSGTATDPNAGLLLALLGVAVLGTTGSRRHAGAGTLVAPRPPHLADRAA